VLFAEVRITHGHLYVLVAQKLLDLLYCSASHDKMACKGVPKIVEPKVLDVCPFQSRLKAVFYVAYAFGRRLRLCPFPDRFRVLEPMLADTIGKDIFRLNPATLSSS
jgi:hypothetical protein